MSLAAIDREFKVLPLSLIDEPALPSRSAMDDQKLEELTTSIRAHGLIQPMVVAHHGERYEVVAGHRRRIACGRAGLVAAPCIVYPSRTDALDAIQFAENRHREELSPADEAIWFSELLEQKCGGDIEQLCARVGEKLSYVDNRLELFHGDPDVFAALQAGTIKIGVAHALNQCSDAHYRRYYLDAAIRGGATVAVVVGWITEWKNLFGGPPAPAPAPLAGAIGSSSPVEDYFTCYVCREKTNVHAMRPVNIHDYCLLAILDKMLTAYRGETQ